MSEKIFKPVADVFALIHAGGEPYSWTQDAAVAAEWLRYSPKYSVQEFVSLERYQAAITEDLSALQKKLDAVVAENASMRSAIDQTIGWQESVDAENVESVRLLVDLKTPATNAILNAVRAEGSELCVQALVTSDDDEFTDAPNICAAVAQQLRADANKDVDHA